MTVVGWDSVATQRGKFLFIAEVGAVMPKAFKLLAGGGKRSATTGKGTWCGQHPGWLTAWIPPGCVIRLE